MSLTTSVPKDQTSKTDDDHRSYLKPLMANQPRTSSYRSFGREIINIDSKTDTSIDTSKNATQSIQTSKENYSNPLKPSLSNDLGLERASVKPTQDKEQIRVVDQQLKTSPSYKSTKETTEEDDDLASADFEKLLDPQYVVCYIKEIFNHLRETEEKWCAQTGYLARTQTDVNEKMRAILVDWLVDVHLKFKLLPETLFLTVNIIDRYLEQVPVSRQKLQLVGVSAMLIASKYEEIYPPEVKEFEYVTDRAYKKEEILDMEGRILGCLKFNLTTPSSLKFLERYAMVARLDEKMLNMAKYLLELALVEYKMIKYTPSNIACSAIYLVNKIHKKEGWSSLMIKQGKYSETQLRPCAKDLCILLQNVGKSSLQAVRRKFSSNKYTQASKIQIDKA